MVADWISQFLTDSSCRLRGARRLDTNDFDEIRNTAPVIFLVLFAAQAINLDGDSRVRLLLNEDNHN